MEQLQSDAVPRLRALLVRENLAASARDGDMGFLQGEQHRKFFDRALAALIVDQGPSKELDRLIGCIGADPEERQHAANGRYVKWLRDRSAMAG